ncbi:hypothetical protein SAMN05192533_101352 [Mesobacillus persicus]|uniref:Alkylhydroperoxidase family enzyme, contains CxxC motif n=1 Tax=Mesobacillus persicus TaxID=930146 RepID=A0A1H7WBL8_9BACI|nr:hypothetical protein [Mesobacillus persicus]SEM18972.1 hypothetical protein SAMN05192533_101352 [Mesobacillus persicus]
MVVQYDEKTEKVLQEVKEYYGSIPQTYYATADAGVLPRLWALAGVTFRTGAAEHEDKRICAAVIAHTLGIQGLLEAHLMILKHQMGWNREQFEQLLQETYPARMNDRQILVAKLAKSLAANPVHVDREVLQGLKNQGLSKEGIAELIALHGFVRYMATFVSVYDMA